MKMLCTKMCPHEILHQAKKQEIQRKPLKLTIYDTFAYQGIRNVSFSENFVYAIHKKKLCGPFLRMRFNCLKATESL